MDYTWALLANIIKMKLHCIAFILLVIGGLNWLLMGLFDWGIGNLFASESIIPKIIYIIVGLSAVYTIVTHKKTCKMCDKGGAPSMGMGQ